MIGLWLLIACGSDNIGIVPAETREMAQRVRRAIDAAGLAARVDVRDADTLEVVSDDHLLKVGMENLRGPCARSEAECNDALAKITKALARPRR